MNAVNLSRRVAALEGRRSRPNRRVRHVLITDDAGQGPADRSVLGRLAIGRLWLSYVG